MTMGSNEERESRYLLALEALSDAIRKARIHSGLSQEEAAHRAGVSVYTIVSLERARTSKRPPNPTLETTFRILWALEIAEPLTGQNRPNYQ